MRHAKKAVARRDTILLAMEASKRPFSRRDNLSRVKSVLIQNIDIRKALGEVYETGEVNQEILIKSAERLEAMTEKSREYGRKYRENHR